MDIKIYEASGKVLVRLKGRIVLDECDRLKSTITTVINPEVTNLNLDLSGVDFIDSAGLGALVGVKVTSNKHRTRLALINPSRGVSDILMVSKLDSIFDILTGSEAEELLRSLAQPQYERSAGGPAVGPQLSRGPAMPVMPGMGGLRNAPPPAPASSVPPAAAAGTAASPKDRIDQLCRDAVAFMQKTDYEQAASCYQQVIDISPDYLPAYNNLAIVFEKMPGAQGKAIEAWKKVLELSSRRNDAKHIERAQKHLETLRR